MGYLIVDPDIELREQEAVQSWLVDLGMIIEDLRVRRDLTYSVDRLEFLYNRDMLTGIYNRRGVEQFFGSYYDECRKNGTGLAIIAFDMDDLKKINDTYGHNEGDYSIKLIADGMSAAAGEDEICTRAGGDEFVVLAKNYDQEKMDAYIENVRRYIAEKVIEDNKQYDVVVSVGTHLGFPQDDFDKDIQKVLEEYQKMADSAMYEEKKIHKNGRSSR